MHKTFVRYLHFILYIDTYAKIDLFCLNHIVFWCSPHFVDPNLSCNNKKRKKNNNNKSTKYIPNDNSQINGLINLFRLFIERVEVKLS